MPLKDWTILAISWFGRNEHVHVIHRHLARNHFNLVLHGNLAQNIPRPNGNLAGQDPLAIFRNPNQVNFQIKARMRPIW